MVTRSWTWPEFYSYICDYEFGSTGTSFATSFEDSGLRGRKRFSPKPSTSRLVVNPAFLQFNTRNPIVQHFLNDKVGDFQRNLVIGESWNIATLPLLAGGPQMILPKIAITLGGTIATSSYLGTLDQYRDLVNFARTGELHGQHLIGRSHT